jgi:hypothetical protein
MVNIAGKACFIQPMALGAGYQNYESPTWTYELKFDRWPENRSTSPAARGYWAKLFCRAARRSWPVTNGHNRKGIWHVWPTDQTLSYSSARVTLFC